MARRKYRPYPTRRQQKNRRMRNLALVLIVLIAGFLILNQMFKNKPETPQTPIEDNIPPVTLDDLNPNGPAVSQPPEENRQEEVPGSEPVAADPPEEPQPEPDEPDTIPDAIASSQDNQVSPEAEEMIYQAIALSDEQGKLIPARNLLNDVLKKQLSPSVRNKVKERLTRMADIWLFDSNVYAEDKFTGYYTVPTGDNFTNIERQCKVPHHILMRINGILRDTDLRAGKKIKVIYGPFNAVVYKSTYTMDLYLQTQYIKTYRVGLGAEGNETPSGLWKVMAGKKMIRPSWYDELTGRTVDATDPDYPLGTRWIELEGLDENTKGRTGFAIHGTNEPDSVGTRSSRGCIRLKNADVEEVYDLLYGGVSQVLVMD